MTRKWQLICCIQNGVFTKSPSSFKWPLDCITKISRNWTGHQCKQTVWKIKKKMKSLNFCLFQIGRRPKTDKKNYYYYKCFLMFPCHKMLHTWIGICEKCSLCKSVHIQYITVSSLRPEFCSERIIW